MDVLLAESENAGLRPPSLAMRPRLKSAPEKLLKSPMVGRNPNTALPLHRKALGVLALSSSAVNTHERKRVKPQEAPANPAPLIQEEEYPEMEKFSPYDPLEFEKYSVPDDLVPLSCLALPGLVDLPPSFYAQEEAPDTIDLLPISSPVKMPKRSDDYSLLEEFLQTLDELTFELPLESECTF